MNIDNPFDKKLEAQKHVIPEKVAQAAIFVTDTMDLCWASAQAVFADQALPEHAIAIYKLVLARLDKGNPG